MKGISPLLATILLIAFTVAVSGIISLWLISFSKTTTTTVGTEAETQLVCSYAGISLYDVKYSNNYLSGTIENVGSVPLGNISLQVIYTNATQQKFELCLVGNQAISCSVSNISLTSYGDIVTFNISIGGSNYNKIRAIGNCSTAYEITASEVTVS